MNEQQVPQAEQTLEAESPKPQRSLIIALLALLLAVVVALGAYYYFVSGSAEVTETEINTDVADDTSTPEVDEVTDTASQVSWETYAAAGLQFNYPVEWKLKLLNEGVRTTVYTTDIDNPDPTAAFGGVFSMSYGPNQGGLTLEGWWAEANKNNKYTKTGETTIAGYLAYTALVNNSDDPEHIIFITHPKDAMSYIVDITIVAKGSKEILAS
ncbi:MAG: hypothetical protein WC030_03490, partial [Candidatus Paceibacterota bacterium]